MRHFVVAVISVALFAVFVAFASAIAGPFSDDLGKSLASAQAVRNEGPGTLAGRGLFIDPAVARSMASFEDYLDKPKLEALFGPK